MKRLPLRLRWPILLGVVGLLGCASTGNVPIEMNLSLMAQPAVMPISEISQQPSSEQTVVLRGRVTQRVPLLETQVYELEDTSGKIWVLTREEMPQLDQELTIEGQLRFKSIPIEGQELGSVYVEEVKRL